MLVRYDHASNRCSDFDILDGHCPVNIHTFLGTFLQLVEIFRIRRFNELEYLFTVFL